MTDIHPAADDDHHAVQRKLSTSSSSNVKEKVDVERANALVSEDNKKEGGKGREFDKKLRVAFLIGLAALILGWWISSTVLKATRDRWQVSHFRIHPCVLKSPVGLYRRSLPGSS